jgi:hypothetical protein
MKLEDWTALASLGLSVMLVALLLSFYNFLIGPEGKGPERVVEPGSLLLQIVFISGAPGIALAGFAFGMSRTYGARLGGIFLIAAGIVVVAGMAASTTLLDKIQDQYIVGGVGVVPYFFMPAGAGVAGLGGYLMVQAKRRSARPNLDDLR